MALFPRIRRLIHLMFSSSYSFAGSISSGYSAATAFGFLPRDVSKLASHYRSPRRPCLLCIRKRKKSSLPRARIPIIIWICLSLLLLITPSHSLALEISPLRFRKSFLIRVFLCVTKAYFRMNEKAKDVREGGERTKSSRGLRITIFRATTDY